MYRRILVPTDGSACSDEAIRHAVGIAKTMRSDLVVLFVMDTLANYHEGVMDEVRRTLAEQGAAALAHAESSAHERGVPMQAELLEGDPADVILRRSEDFDLVVMGSQGKGLLKRLTVGSVTEAVLRHVARPLLIIRRAGDPQH